MKCTLHLPILGARRVALPGAAFRLIDPGPFFVLLQRLIALVFGSAAVNGLAPWPPTKGHLPQRSPGVSDHPVAGVGASLGDRQNGSGEAGR